MSNGGVIVVNPKKKNVKHTHVHWDEEMIARRASKQNERFDRSQLLETDGTGKLMYFDDITVLDRVKEHQKDIAFDRSKLSDRQSAQAERFAKAQRVFDREQYLIKIGNVVASFATTAGLVYIFYYFMDQFKGGKSNRKTRKNKRAITN